MTEFIPLGYVSLSAALDRICQADFGEAWTLSHVTDSERETLICHKYALRQQRNGHYYNKRFEAAAISTPAIRDIEARLIRRTEIESQCWEKLRGLLLVGDLPAYGLTEHHAICSAPVDAWGRKKAESPPDKIWVRPKAGSVGVHQATPIIAEDDLMKVLAGQSARKVNADQQSLAPKLDARPPVQPTPMGRGGRRPTYDKAALVIEAAKLLYDGFQPVSQAELRKRALEVYSNTLPEGTEPPSDDWAKPFIRTLWNRFGLKGRN